MMNEKGIPFGSIEGVLSGFQQSYSDGLQIPQTRNHSCFESFVQYIELPIG